MELFFLFSFESPYLFFLVPLYQLLFLLQVISHLLNIVSRNCLWFYVFLDYFTFNMPVQRLRYLHFNYCTKINLNLLFQIFLKWNDHFCVVFCMSHKILHSLMNLCLIYPDLLFSSNHIPMFIIRLEQLSQFCGSALDNLRWDLFQTARWSTWP